MLILVDGLVETQLIQCFARVVRLAFMIRYMDMLDAVQHRGHVQWVSIRPA